jgi:hypothetical protein
LPLLTYVVGNLYFCENHASFVTPSNLVVSGSASKTVACRLQSGSDLSCSAALQTCP